MFLETISKDKVYYMFRCDDKRRGNLPTDKSFSLTEVSELTNLLDKCNTLKLNYDLVIQNWDEESETIVSEMYIVGNNDKNNYLAETKRYIGHFYINEDIQIQIDHKNPNWLDVYGKLLIEYIDEHLQDNDFVEDTIGVWRDTSTDKIYSLEEGDIQQLKTEGFCRMYLIN